MTSLYQPATMGATKTANRVFMAPLTRNRAKNESDIPGDLAEKYYSQRASAGLILTEATQINPQGKGYASTPGIYNDDHITAWKKITDAVHAADGKIFLQLWHVGRISHTSLQPDNAQPLAPSAIRAEGTTVTPDGEVELSEPRAMTEDEINSTVADYKSAAERAREAGFDGVEIHAANGYLIDQFLRDKTNKRDDQYGGSAANRARFLMQILDAVIPVWGADKVGIRLSPTGTFNDIEDSHPLETFGYVIDRLNEYNLAYLHMVERFPGMDVSNMDLDIIQTLRARWNGFYIANGDYDKLKGETAIESGYADAITYGRPFIANPDLPARLEAGAPLNEPDQETFYGGGREGYTDYPFMKDQQAA